MIRVALLLLASLPPPATGSRAGSDLAAGPAPGISRALEVASARVGSRHEGCAALVREAYGLPAGTSVRSLLSRVRLEKTPAPGDLVFLADRPGGPAEHVGIVASVNAEGTALVIHDTERGVARIRVNGAQPWKTRSDSGRALNDVLVVPAGKITAGRLLVGYASSP